MHCHGNTVGVCTHVYTVTQTLLHEYLPVWNCVTGSLDICERIVQQNMILRRVSGTTPISYHARVAGDVKVKDQAVVNLIVIFTCKERMATL